MTRTAADSTCQKNTRLRLRGQTISANLRLVVKIARECENLGLPLLDVINEGNLGLMRAVERFDPDKGAKFSTYSSLWIKERIRQLQNIALARLRLMLEQPQLTAASS